MWVRLGSMTARSLSSAMSTDSNEMMSPSRSSTYWHKQTDVRHVKHLSIKTTSTSHLQSIYLQKIYVYKSPEIYQHDRNANFLYHYIYQYIYSGSDRHVNLPSLPPVLGSNLPSPIWAELIYYLPTLWWGQFRMMQHLFWAHSWSVCAYHHILGPTFQLQRVMLMITNYNWCSKCCANNIIIHFHSETLMIIEIHHI